MTQIKARIDLPRLLLAECARWWRDRLAASLGFPVVVQAISSPCAFVVDRTAQSGVRLCHRGDACHMEPGELSLIPVRVHEAKAVAIQFRAAGHSSESDS